MRFRRRVPPPPDPTCGIDPTDVAELESRFRALDADELERQRALVVSRLRPLVLRRVPVRGVDAVPALHTVRIRFADGTAVMGRGAAAGDAGVLAALVRRRSVWPDACRSDAAGTHLVLAWAGGRQMSVLITGLDQPV